jgi:hypothetical protein
MKSSTLGIALTILIGGAIALTPKESNTKATAPPANTCYVPGGSGCGSSSCHNTSINIGSGFIQATFSGANNEYVPGQTYTINVTISDDTKQRFGFQAASVDQNNMQAGTFIVTNTNNTSTQSSGGLSFIGHKAANSSATWSFDWTAPSANVGPIKFYLAGNAANNNNSDSGDNIYTSQLPVNPAQGVGLTPVMMNDAFKIISQDPSQLVVQVADHNAARSISIISMAGQILYQNTVNAGETMLRIPYNHLANGIYLIQCDYKSIKFVKQ